eukprot:gnl/TRDRNA2_/TRDRNA2_201475_c0_seq1.p1 gnl/TRDRNA2_/TRDRNA2_201475_c0~~gnl/TRDRNA2_/TRDRNA2_201475_c0_seq1.p1  ORF type:complete len:463 (+),score=14.14 gnl/TRDRNA2_/TRDRNA2_201475_c0_seq1:114-1391(+)
MADFGFCADEWHCDEPQIVARDVDGKKFGLDVYISEMPTPDQVSNLKAKLASTAERNSLTLSQLFEDGAGRPFWESDTRTILQSSSRLRMAFYLRMIGGYADMLERTFIQKLNQHLEKDRKELNGIYYEHKINISNLRDELNLLTCSIRTMAWNQTCSEGHESMSLTQLTQAASDVDASIQREEARTAEIGRNWSGNLLHCFLVGGRKIGGFITSWCNDSWSCPSLPEFGAVDTWGCTAEGSCREPRGNFISPSFTSAGPRSRVWQFHQAFSQSGYCHWKVDSEHSQCPFKAFDPSSLQSWCREAVEANACYLATRNTECFCSTLSSHGAKCCGDYSARKTAPLHRHDGLDFIRYPDLHIETDPFNAMACDMPNCSAPAPQNCELTNRSTSSNAVEGNFSEVSSSPRVRASSLYVGLMFVFLEFS